MGDARDVLSIAFHLLRQFGEEAERVAAERAAGCRADADEAAALLWRRVARAIRGVQTERRPVRRAPRAQADPAAALLADPHVRIAFEAMPHAYLLLKPDLTIAGANDAYLSATLTRRDEILGRGMFEVFPDNPDLPGADGATNLKASLLRVLESGKPDHTGVHRYDVRARDGTFQERWWTATNVPGLAEDGTLLLIVHHVTDVTARVAQRLAATAADATSLHASRLLVGGH